MKKIAFVTRVLASGGAETVLSYIVRACLEHGMECMVIAMQPYHLPSCMPEAAQQYVLEPAGGALGKIKSYLQVRRMVKEFGADIVLSMPEDIGIYVIGAMLGTGIPVVVSERNNPWVMPYKKETRLLRRLMYPLAKG